MTQKTNAQQRLVFILALPAALATVAVIALLALDSPKQQIAVLVVSFIGYIVYSSFKNGSFRSIRHRFKFGYEGRWDHLYPPEVRENQVYAINLIFSITSFVIATQNTKLREYGIYGFILSLFIIIITVGLLIINHYRANKKYYFKTQQYEFTAKILFCTTIVVFLSQIYVSFGTSAIFVPTINILCFIFCCHKKAILPMKNEDIISLARIFLIVSCIPTISIIWQLSFVTAFAPLIIISIIIVLIVVKAPIRKPQRVFS